MVYTRMDDRGRTMVFDAVIPELGGGLHVRTNPAGSFLPDNEIPDLMAALQRYMSRRANQMAKQARK